MPDQEPDLSRALQELERRQVQLDQAQQALGTRTVVGRSRDGFVTVRARALGGITGVEFDGAIFEEHDEESLAVAVMQAITQAVTRSAALFQESMGELLAFPELDALTAQDESSAVETPVIV